MASATQLEEAVKKLMDYYSGLGKGSRLANAGPNSLWKPDYLEDVMEQLEEPFTFKLYSDCGDALTLDGILKALPLLLTANMGGRMRMLWETNVTPPWWINQLGALVERAAPDAAAQAANVGVSHVCGLTSDNPINTQLTGPTFGKPNLGAIVIQHPSYGPRFCNIQAASLLLNYMPSLEMSRAYPVIKMFQLLPQPAVSRAGNIIGPSLMKFLGVHNLDKSKLASPALALAAVRVSELSAQSPSRVPVGPDMGGVVGHEMFLSPQMLINRNQETVAPGTAIGNRKTDDAAPYMSLKQLTLQESWLGDQGAMTSFDCNIQMILHDRAQLSSIRDLVEYGRYNLIKWCFEIGWNHPGGNVWGSLLNAGKMIFVGQTEDSTYSLNPEGGLTIDIKFKGLPTDASSDAHFFEGNVLTEFKFSRYLTILARKLNNDANPNNDSNGNTQVSRTREGPPASGDRVFPASILGKLYDALAAKDHQTLPLPDTTTLQFAIDAGLIKADNELIALTPTKDDSGAALDTVGAAVASTKRALKNGWDPFLRKIKVPDKGTITEKDFRCTPASAITPKEVKYVSFGKAALLLMGAPMATQGFADEVQFMFNPVNKQAGAAAQCNICSLPLPIDKVEKILDNAMDATNSQRSGSQAVMNAIVREIIKNPSYVVYGKPIPTGTVPDIPDVSTGESTTTPDIISTASGLMNTEFGNIGSSDTPVMPEIICRMENTVSIVEGVSTQVCRVIWYDGKAGPFQLEKLMLSATSGDEIAGSNDLEDTEAQSAAAGVIGELDRPSNEREISGFKKFMGGTFNILLKDPVTGEAVIDPGANYREFKNTLKTFLPSIIYGSAGSTVTQLSSNTTTSQRAQRVQEFNFARAQTEQTANQEEGDAAAANSTPPSPEAQVIPSELSVTCMGNPFIRTGQEFYVDMQTGTAMDTVYLVKNVKHTITQGSYTTQFKLAAMQTVGMYVDGNQLGSIISRIARSAASLPFGTGA